MQEIKIKTIIIGLGNPIVRDDGVGIKVSRLLKERITDDSITIKEIYVGGLALMEAIVGYDRALIIDAIQTGAPIGSSFELSLSSIRQTRNSCCSHNTNLESALEIGRLAGLVLPSDIKFWAIEAKDVTTFSEDLSHELEIELPDIVDRIISYLKIGEI